MPYKNANPDASPFVLVTHSGIPVAMPQGISAGDVLLCALSTAEVEGGPVEVYNDGTHVATVSAP